MSQKVTGIHNFSKMNDVDKSYIVKLLGTILAGIIAGIISGSQYEPGGSFDAIDSGRLGFLIFFVATGILAFIIKMKYDLSKMSNQQIFRHGIFIGLLNYLFFWTVVFNYIHF